MKKNKFKADDIIKHIISCSICEEKEISSEELYDAFKKTINSEKRNDFRRFAGIIGVDEKFESRYRIKNHSIESDYINICQEYF